MNRSEAMQALREGKKITHVYFTDGEFVYLEEGKVMYEDGASSSVEFFWSIRENELWDKGWKIYEES